MIVKREAKREADPPTPEPTHPSAHKLVHTPWHKKFGLALTLSGLSIHNAHSIESLAELFDNVTAKISHALRSGALMLDQIALVVNQHTLVLDYLTAAQGGMCQVVGPACCHYVDNSSVVQIRADVQEAQDMIEKYRKEHVEQDWNPSWPDWLSWLNPSNWFQGIGGWFGGILHTLMNILLVVGGAILFIILITKLIGCMFTAWNKNKFKL